MWLIAAACLLAACSNRELCYDHTHWLDLRIEFDWSAEPDADPSAMVVYLFPTDRSQPPRRYELSEYGGINVRVPAGEYNAVTFNGETETLTEIGDSYESFMVSTHEQDLLSPMMRTNLNNAPRPVGTENQPVKTAPDKMWSGKLENISILPGVKGQSIRFTPTLSTSMVHIKLINVSGLDYDIELSAALSSVAESYHIAEQRHAGADVTMPMSLNIVDNSTITGEASIFGHCDVAKGGTPKKHILTIYTSNKYYYTYDVTSQIHEAVDPANIEIVIDGFEVHVAGAGVSQDVAGWDEVINEAIDM